MEIAMHSLHFACKAMCNISMKIQYSFHTFSLKVAIHSPHNMYPLILVNMLLDIPMELRGAGLGCRGWALGLYRQSVFSKFSFDRTSCFCGTQAQTRRGHLHFVKT